MIPELKESKSRTYANCDEGYAGFCKLQALGMIAKDSMNVQECYCILRML